MRFVNADGTLLKSEQVECGDDATAPQTSSLNGMKFKKWSRDYTNVHSNLSVYATYTLQGGDYKFNVRQTVHTNSVNPMAIEYSKAFKNSQTRAMVGDSLTFTATMRMPQAATLYFQTAQYKNNTRYSPRPCPLPTRATTTRARSCPVLPSASMSFATVNECIATRLNTMCIMP